MAANKIVRLGPIALGTAVSNVFNPPTLTGGVNPPAGSTNSFLVLHHIRALNKTASAVNISAYIGTSSGAAAGTEFGWNTSPVAAFSYVEWFGRLRLDTSDYLTASASAATSITIEAEGEIGVA